MPQNLWQRSILRLLRGVLHLLFWCATVFTFVCFMGSMRWLTPGANPSAGDLLPLGYTLLLGLGLFTLFYVYDTFWGDAPGSRAKRGAG